MLLFYTLNFKFSIYTIFIFIINHNFKKIIFIYNLLIIFKTLRKIIIKNYKCNYKKNV